LSEDVYTKCCIALPARESLHVDLGRELVHSECCRSSCERLGTDLVNCTNVLVSLFFSLLPAGFLTNEVLCACRISLVLRQVVEEQLYIGIEGCVRTVGRGSEEAVDLHGAIVSEIQVEFVPCDRDCSDRSASLGDRPDTSVAAKPMLKSA
jgi:hypothetical protein